MAVQAVLGIGALGGLISAIAKAVIEFFFTKAAKRIAVVLLVVGALYTATNVLLQFMASVASQLLANAPPEVAFIGLALPSNTVECLSIIISCEMACLTWSLTYKALQFQTQVAS